MTLGGPMEMLVPNKTIYVSDDDLPFYERAQDLSGGNLSAAISAAVRRDVEGEQGPQQGYDGITVRGGAGAGRKGRISGALLGAWGRAKSTREEGFRAYRSPKGKVGPH